MPFRNRIYRPYSREDVECLKQNQNGIYAIFSGSTVVYIGSGDIRERLLAHLSGEKPEIARHNPDRWLGRVFTEDPTSRMKELIKEYSPVCNSLDTQ